VPNHTIRLRNIIFTLGLLFAANANAALLSFDLSYSGAVFGNSATATATATGTITLDDTILANPGGNLANAAAVGVTAFAITVSGAGSIDGTHTLLDYGNFRFNTAGSTLDLSVELVGQAAGGGTFASTTCTTFCGDFNFFTTGGVHPTAIDAFTIGGGGQSFFGIN
jgi:hypothetical protein